MIALIDDPYVVRRILEHLGRGEHNPRCMDLAGVEVFVKVVEAGSFSRAARLRLSRQRFVPANVSAFIDTALTFRDKR